MESYSLHKLVPAYRGLNEVYQHILSTQRLTFKYQKLITDFYEENSNERLFEEMLIECLHGNGKDVFLTSTTVLKDLIRKNIDLHNEHGSFLSGFDTYKICREVETKFDTPIEQQLALLKPINDEISRLDSALESASWDNDGIKTKAVEKAMKEARVDYDKEKHLLDKLYLEKQALAKEVAQYCRNIFSDIYALSNSYFNILDQYTKNESPADSKGNIPKPHENHDGEIFFDMGWISKIRATCNQRQFFEVSEIGFYEFFNLRGASVPKIKSGETIRVYYLLHKMSETLEGETKRNWLAGILELFQIKRSNYNSKYRNCVSDLPGTENRKFAKEIDNLFDTL
jgi:hypothetical protein